MQILKLFFLPVLWGMVIFALISMPASAIPEQSFFNIPHFDKLVHATIFFIFSFLICVGFYYKNSIYKKKQVLYSQFIIVLIVGLIYGGITEIIQEYFLIDRDGDWIDFCANTVGVFMGILGFSLLKNTRILKAFKFLEK
jgi:VanZ family protein